MVRLTSKTKCYFIWRYDILELAAVKKVLVPSIIEDGEAFLTALCKDTSRKLPL